MVEGVVEIEDGASREEEGVLGVELSEETVG